MKPDRQNQLDETTQRRLREEEKQDRSGSMLSGVTWLGPEAFSGLLKTLDFGG